MASLGIAIEARPTDEQKQEIKTSAIQAMNTRDAQGNPQITYPDYLFVCRVLDSGNLKLAEAVLAHRISKRAQEQQQINMQNIQANAETQQQSLQAKAQGDQQLVMIETQAEITKINAEADAQIRIDNNKLAQTKEIELIKAGSKERQTSEKNQTDVARKVIESNTALEKENIKGSKRANKRKNKRFIFQANKVVILVECWLVNKE